MKVEKDIFKDQTLSVILNWIRKMFYSWLKNKSKQKTLDIF